MNKRGLIYKNWILRFILCTWVPIAFPHLWNCSPKTNTVGSHTYPIINFEWSLTVTHFSCNTFLAANRVTQIGHSMLYLHDLWLSASSSCPQSNKHHLVLILSPAHMCYEDRQKKYSNVTLENWNTAYFWGSLDCGIYTSWSWTWPMV